MHDHGMLSPELVTYFLLYYANGLFYQGCIYALIDYIVERYAGQARQKTKLGISVRCVMSRRLYTYSTSTPYLIPRYLDESTILVWPYFDSTHGYHMQCKSRRGVELAPFTLRLIYLLFAHSIMPTSLKRHPQLLAFTRRLPQQEEGLLGGIYSHGEHKRYQTNTLGVYFLDGQPGFAESQKGGRSNSEQNQRVGERPRPRPAPLDNGPCGWAAALYAASVIFRNDGRFDEPSWSRSNDSA